MAELMLGGGLPSAGALSRMKKSPGWLAGAFFGVENGSLSGGG